MIESALDKLFEKALLLHEKGELNEAINLYSNLIKANPTLPEVYNNLGMALASLDRHKEAAIHFRKAISLKPNLANAYYNLGESLRICKSYEEAIENYNIFLQKSAKSDEDTRKATVGVTTALLHKASDIFEDGELEKAVGLAGYKEALEIYERALKLDPNCNLIHWNMSAVLLALGDYERGWQEYEWRIKLDDRVHSPFLQPTWRGEPIAGKSILILSEQGFGDAIQFMRYVPMVSELGGDVILSLPSELVRLGRTLEGNITTFAFDDFYPSFDLQCPLLSLPAIFKTTIKTIPCKVPYLKAPEQQVAYWKNKISGLSGITVGVVWDGKKKPDKRRSIDFEQLRPLFNIEGVNFISLQKEAKPEGLYDWTDELHDFADTAALIENLDLVISIDTSVAHLAGALGKPVWLLNKYNTSWQWLLNRTDSPWYPTMRLFRQSAPGNWGAVIENVVKELRKL